MSSKTEIMNRACIKAGINTISAPTEDSEQARKLNAVWTSVARAELRRQAWNFAKARAALAPLLVSIGDPQFGVSYNLPADCLRLVWIDGAWVFSTIREAGFTSDFPSFGIEGQTLLTNSSGAANIVYIRDVSEQTQLWDATFVEAFACRLAAEIAQTTTKNRSLKADLRTEYVEHLKEAKRTNAIELPPMLLPDESWVLARLW
jgi:hypothetical protein